MRVLILEDDIIIARDLVEIVEGLCDEVHFAVNYNEAVDLITQFTYGLCLSDINLNGDKTGVCFVKELLVKNPQTGIIFITAHFDDATLKNLEETNPMSFIIKPFTPEQIRTSVKLAIDKLQGKAEALPNFNILTDKEKKILFLITKNHSNKEIGEELFLSDKTVRNHRYNMIKKLELSKVKNELLFYGLKVFSQVNKF
jgi:DNA-binding NarL/FixJ family response regulator